MMGPKSNQFIKVEYPQSMDTLLALLEVLKDPNKIAAQTKALKDFMDKANQTIETLGKAEQIDGILTDAKAKQAKADAILESANAEAEQIMEEAKADAKALMDKANSLASQASKDSADARDQKAQYAKLVEDAAKKAADLAKKEAELAEAAQEIERKRALLAQL